MVLQTHNDTYRERLSYQGRVRIFVCNDKIHFLPYQVYFIIQIVMEFFLFFTLHGGPR